MFVDGGLIACYYVKATSLRHVNIQILGKLLKEKNEKAHTGGRLKKMEDTMNEVFRIQQLSYELIAALFGEDRIDEDE